MDAVENILRFDYSAREVTNIGRVFDIARCGTVLRIS